MATAFRCWALAALRLGLGSGAPAPQSPRQEAVCVEALEGGGEGCGGDPGHALIARRAVVSKIAGAETLPEHWSRPIDGPGVVSTVELVGAVEDEPRPAEADAISAPNASAVSNSLLAANDTDPFRGSSDAIADRERNDRDYVRDNDGPWLDGSYPGGRKHFSTPRSPDEEPEEDEVKKQKHGLALRFVVPLAFVIFAVFTIANLMEKFGISAAIPESLIMILIGFLLGCFLKMYAGFEFFDNAETFSKGVTSILNLVLLPIIMFASGWSIRRQDFFSQFPYIMLFAVVGVALSTCVVAGLIWLTGLFKLHSITAGRTAFAYAALISATDPVATLSTYTKLKVDPLLNILVFGESVINDAVAIVLFDVFNSDYFMMDKRGNHLTGWELLGSIILGVGKKFTLSSLFGVALAMLYTIIAHWAGMHHNKKGQILVILASCYLTYALAESLHMSGIIAEIFCGLIMGVYMRPLLSLEGSLLATFFVKQLAMLADACVFLLVGVSVVQLTTKGWYFGLWVMLFCLLGRFAAVFPLALVTNAMKSAMGKVNGVPYEGWNLLSPQTTFMMWHAGLRGAIALALSLELGKWVDEVDGAGTKRALQTATFLLIVVFLIVFGGSTQACLNRLGIPMGKDAPANALIKTEGFGHLNGILKWVDKAVMTPLLIGSGYKHDPSEDERDVEDVLRAQRW